MDPFQIPEHWPRAVGIAVTPNAVAALWGARDTSGTIHLYAEHLLGHAEPSENARAIKKVGEWIPGVLNVSGLKGTQADKDRITRIYRDQGLKIQHSMQAAEAGVYELWQLLATNKLKVFASLSGFLAEYRIGDGLSPLLLCCHALLLSARECMRTKPLKQPALLSKGYNGPHGWMA